MGEGTVVECVGAKRKADPSANDAAEVLYREIRKRATEGGNGRQTQTQMASGQRSGRIMTTSALIYGVAIPVDCGSCRNGLFGGRNRAGQLGRDGRHVFGGLIHPLSAVVTHLKENREFLAPRLTLLATMDCQIESGNEIPASESRVRRGRCQRADR